MCVCVTTCVEGAALVANTWVCLPSRCCGGTRTASDQPTAPTCAHTTTVLCRVRVRVPLPAVVATLYPTLKATGCRAGTRRSWVPRTWRATSSASLFGSSLATRDRESSVSSSHWMQRTRLQMRMHTYLFGVIIRIYFNSAQEVEKKARGDDVVMSGTSLQSLAIFNFTRMHAVNHNTYTKGHHSSCDPWYVGSFCQLAVLRACLRSSSALAACAHICRVSSSISDLNATQ